MAPLISVVASTRNQAGTLGAMVEAVLGQVFDGDLELIVVDDASTDGTPALLAELAAKHDGKVIHLRSEERGGAATGRNRGLEIARGDYIAFTDSDCVPDPGWLAALLAAFDSPGVGIVQGRTIASEDRAPLFSHYIETLELDGSCSTSNIAYRREALGSRRFDPACDYWEDVDLGWRVIGAGWECRFAPNALVRHQIIPLTPSRWLLWPRRFVNWPAKAARYPAFRKHLFLSVWVSPIHMWFDLALVGLALALVNRWALLLVLPYLVQLVRTRGLRGRFPPVKAALHVAWDAVAFASLVAGSARHRSLVL